MLISNSTSVRQFCSFLKCSLYVLFLSIRFFFFDGMLGGRPDARKNRDKTEGEIQEIVRAYQRM